MKALSVLQKLKRAFTSTFLNDSGSSLFGTSFPLTNTFPSSRQDRGPIARHPRLKKKLIPVLSIAAAIVFGIGIGWFGASGESVSGEFPKALAEHENDLVPPESLFRFVPSRQGGLTQVATSDPRLVWDDSTPLHQVQRRIENMRPTDLLDWGEKAVPLEALPSSSRNRFRTVGSNN